MTAYLPLHGESPGFQSGALGSPVPPSGSLGSVRLSGSFPVQFKTGDKITIFTGGIAYVYYSTTEILTGYTYSVYVPVWPEIQTTHLASDTWVLQRRLVSPLAAMNAIVTANCNSADISVPGAAPNRRRNVLPWVRAWPWAADQYGISWGQSGLLALIVKPIYAATDFDDPTVGQYWNIPVPRAIGAEYTQFSPRSLGQSYGYYRTAATAAVGPSLSDYDVLFPTEYRDQTSVRGRATLSALRQRWQPLPQVFSLDVADPNTVPNGSFSPTANSRITAGSMSFYQWQLVRMATENYAFPSAQTTAYGVGSRGGRYSICGYYYDNTLGGPSGFSVEVRAIVPGLGDILITSIACTSGATAFAYGPVTTGTWAGVVVPTALTGTCVEFYILVRVANSGSISLTYGSHVVVADSVQVPWAHHVITGNDHAPGGLIAPFY